MGYDYCECCGKRDYRDEIVYGCCAKETEGLWCENCSCKEPLKKCAKCKEEFCENHGFFKPKECCGLFFCGTGEDEDEGNCLKDHKTKRRACGHLTCNFNKGGCLICKADGDVQLAKDLKKACKSASLKKCLSDWLKETQAISKKAEKEKEKSLLKVAPKLVTPKQTSKKRKSSR